MYFTLRGVKRKDGIFDFYCICIYNYMDVHTGKKMNKPITPTDVSYTPPVESGRDKARRILHIKDNIDDLTADDLLQYIFELSQQVLHDDPRNAVSFRVAIDAMKDLYKEIQNKPAKPKAGKDESEQFLIDWGIKDAEETV